jgi:hypothetical protein
MVIKESMRLWPVASMTVRKLEEPEVVRRNVLFAILVEN